MPWRHCYRIMTISAFEGGSYNREYSKFVQNAYFKCYFFGEKSLGNFCDFMVKYIQA